MAEFDSCDGFEMLVHSLSKDRYIIGVDVAEEEEDKQINYTIMENIIGKKVIIRSDRAGVFFGTLVGKKATVAGVEVILKDSRRIWYWDGANSLSQLAMEGVKKPDTCKFTVTVPMHNVMQVIEIIPCTEEAIKSIESVKVWRQD